MVRRVIRRFLPVTVVALLALAGCQDIGLKAAVQLLATLHHRIAFASDRDSSPTFETYVMEFDGSNVRRITEDAVGSYPVAWSADGRYLAIASSQLSLWDAETGTLAPIPATTGYTFHSWSPDGRHMLLLDPANEMEIRNRYGSGSVPLGLNYPSPCPWSASTGRLVVMDDSAGNWEIVTMEPNGTDLLNLTNNPANDSSPFFSPDGSRIVFTSNRDGPSLLYTMNADGSDVRQIGGGQVVLWSPTGEFILVFDGTWWWTARANQEQQTQLSTSQFIEYILWRPDGLKLFFTDREVGDPDLYSICPDASSRTQLTDDIAWEIPKCFSPEGKKIVLETDRDGNSEIYTMDLDGGNPTNLTDNAAEDVGPVW